MDSDLVEIFRGGGGKPRADFLSATLEAEGIPCVVRGHGVAGYPMTVGPMAEFQILVDADDADRASEVLESLEAAAQEQVANAESDEEENYRGRPFLDYTHPARYSIRQRVGLIAVGGACVIVAVYLLLRDVAIALVLLLIGALLIVSAIGSQRS